MTKEDGELNEVSESDKMLAEIDAAKKAISSKAEPLLTDEATSDQNPPEKEANPTVEPEAAPEKSGQAVSQTEAPTDKKAGKPDVDVREWAKKKGIKDADAAFRSLRELEQRLSKANAELKAKENVPRETFYQPQPTFRPAQPMYQAPPAYPAYQLTREQIIEQEAQRRGWDKGDFEKVLDLSNELISTHVRKLDAQYEARFQELGKETRRNSELRELMQDPLFTNDKVQFEMHKVFEENPRAFDLEPSPYLYAFNEAQRRLARSYLQGDITKTEEEGGNSTLPTSPPKEGTKASNPSFEKSKENALLESFEKAKTSEEQRKILTTLGAVQSY